MLCLEWQVQRRSCACKCKVFSSVGFSSDSCGTHETVASPTSWHTPCAMSHVSHVPLMSHVASESNHTHESCHNRVMSHVCMSLVTQSARTYTFGFVTWQYFTCVTWLLHTCAMTYWHDSFTGVTWALDMERVRRLEREGAEVQVGVSHLTHIMSHVTRMNETCHIYKWVMEPLPTSASKTMALHSPDVKRGVFVWWVSSDLSNGPVIHMNESRPKYVWVKSHVWMIHVAHNNESFHSFYT